MRLVLPRKAKGGGIPCAGKPVAIGVKPHAVAFGAAIGQKIGLRQIGRGVFATIARVSGLRGKAAPGIQRLALGILGV